MKVFSRLQGAFEGALLVATTLVMAVPLLVMLMEPAAKVVH
jgi:hypothetical protein